MSGDATEAGTEERYRSIFEGVRSRLCPMETWRVHTGEMWTSCEPPGHASRPQGWKLHVSATAPSAEDVLARAAEVLVASRAAFKFAKSETQVRDLLAMRAERGSSGKFITVYPDDDDHLRHLAKLLDEATQGLAGPQILSDRPYRPGSLVHYRYGGFVSGMTRLTNEGAFEPVLVTADGRWVADERLAWFKPPSWAPDPFAGGETDPASAGQPGATDGGQGGQAEEREAASGQSKQVLLDDRFVVGGAIRHSNRGGVYRARDERTGKDVIIKQARPHVAAQSDGTDARDWLRHEADMLDRFSPEGLMPGKVSLFEYQGHMFLAEDAVPGVSLQQWPQDLARATKGGCPGLADVLSLVRQLVDIVRVVHDAGLVLRDLNPANAILTPEGRVVLIDPEFIATPGTIERRVITPGFAAPEVVDAPHEGPVADGRADLYSLGASIFYLCAGADLRTPEDDDSALRSRAERRAILIRAYAVGNPTLRRLMPLVEALLAEEPADRPDLDGVRASLDDIAQQADNVDTTIGVLVPGSGEVDRLLDDTLATIADAMTPGASTLWPEQWMEGKLLDPCAVQGGAAGQVEVLRRGLRVQADGRWHGALREASAWMRDQLRAPRPRILPGLHFGRAGAAWALHDAAADLGDDDGAAVARRVATQLPVAWFNADVTHGTSGAGMTQLHFWRRTGDPIFRDRALACAEHVARMARRQGHTVTWPIPRSAPTALAGITHFGFAHGVAGICTFLLATAQEFDRADLAELASAGSRTLADVAVRGGDAVDWPSGEERTNPSDAAPVSPQWWCSGAAGVGTYLVRSWLATGSEEELELARGAAESVHSARWRLQPTHCHGLVGSGEFMLDMAAATGEDVYLERAREHAELLRVRAAVRDGRQVVFCDAGPQPTYSYSLGLAGVAAFLLRLQYGGPRSFMVDDEKLNLPAP